MRTTQRVLLLPTLLTYAKNKLNVYIILLHWHIHNNIFCQPPPLLALPVCCNHRRQNWMPKIMCSISFSTTAMFANDNIGLLLFSSGTTAPPTNPPILKTFFSPFSPYFPPTWFASAAAADVRILFLITLLSLSHFLALTAHSWVFHFALPVILFCNLSHISAPDLFFGWLSPL